MKRIVVFCALCALFGCRQANTPETEPIALYYSTVEQSKTDLLTQGEEIGVFAAVAGTERYFLDNTKYIVGSDGRSLSTAPAVYYPEAKQAVVFTAYLPFGGAWDGGLGTFSVPSDQTTALALKEADLCWATASSTPVAAPVALEFRHQMARLLITTNEPTEKIAIPNAFLGGTLDIKTGTFTNTLKSDVLTTGTELILPAQTVTRLVLTVAGVDYTFDGAILLESAKTTSINLTLNATTHTATLSGSSTTDWTISTRSGNPNSQIINQLKLHWVAPHADYAKADKVTLTIENSTTNATQDIDAVPTLIAGESSVAVCAYTLPVSLAAGSGFWYPYTVTRARIYYGGTLLRDANAAAMRGGVIYRSGEQTLAINMYIQVRDAATNTTDVKEWLNVDKTGGSKDVKVGIVGAATWTAQVLDGSDKVSTDITVTPNTGANDAQVTLTWSPNITTVAKSNYKIKFFPTGYADVNAVIKTDQAAGPAGVLINKVLWATGNLIASNSTAGARGAGGCKIGAPTDGGLYFQFGSLIGWKGGALANGGTGVGSNPYTGVGTQWWGGVGGYMWANDAMVWPTELVGTKTSWNNTTGANITTLSDYYFNYSVAPWDATGKDIRTFDVSIPGDSGSGDLGSGRYATRGVGDPCTYYLGGTWRLPTGAEYAAICNNQMGISTYYTWAQVGGSWAIAPTFGGNFSSNRLFFPASGYRFGYGSGGSFISVTTLGFGWSSSVLDARTGLYLAFLSTEVQPQSGNFRSTGFPVRCVSSVP